MRKKFSGHWIVVAVFIASFGGCGVQEAILTGATTVVSGPVAAGTALVGGTAAGVGLAIGASANKKKIRPDSPDKWRNIDSYAGVRVSECSKWILEQIKERKDTERERDGFYYAMEYRVINNIPYPTAENPVITVEELRKKIESFERVRKTKKNPKKYSLSKYIEETTSSPL